MLTLPWSFPIPSPNFDFGKSSLTDFNFYLKTKKILVWFNSFFSVLFVFSIHSNTNKDICTMHNASLAHNLSTHSAQAPSTLSGSLVAPQRTSPVVSFSPVSEESHGIIVPFDLISTCCHAQAAFVTWWALWTTVTKQVDRHIHKKPKDTTGFRVKATHAAVGLKWFLFDAKGPSTVGSKSISDPSFLPV